MTTKILLACANNYTNTALQVYGSIDSAETFTECLQPHVVFKLYNDAATTAHFKETLMHLAHELHQGTNVKGYSFYAGHGDHRYSSQFGMQEYYKLNDGILTDEEFTEIFDNCITPENCLVVISDCCSSEHDIKPIVYGRPFLGNWVSFGATLDAEDDMQSGVGVLTEAIQTNFALLKQATMRECEKILNDWLASSWVGSLQHFSIKVAHDALWDVKPFA